MRFGGRFPSVVEMLGRARSTAERFSFVLGTALVAAGAALLYVEDADKQLETVVITALLGLSLFVAIRLGAEQYRLSLAYRVLANLLGVALLLALYLRAQHWTEQVRAMRYLQLGVAFHLAAASLPFVTGGRVRAFWQHNRIMFVRFLLGGVYSAVLFAGLSMALLALEKLFGLDVPDRSYARLWIVIAFIFHPWFFLAGLRRLDELDRLDEYPLALKVFAQFVLVPLVSVYLLILTAYLVRVIVTTEWPRGWIGYLVSSVAAAGTLALLLVHPVRERDDARWVNVYGRWFFVALLPSLAMLFMAIGLRLNQYGFTEPRYFLLALAIWLSGLSLYYGITGSRDIRLIPLTLGLLALLSYTGPWSAYSVSRSSQVARLRGILERNQILVNDALRPAQAGLAYDDAREVSAIVRYLLDAHGRRSLAGVHPSLPDTAARAARAPRQDADRPEAALVVARLGAPYVNQWERQNTTRPGEPISVHPEEKGSIDVEGFDAISRVDLARVKTIPFKGDTVHFTQLAPGVVAVRWQGTDVGRLRYDQVLAELQPGRVRPDSLPTIELQGARLRVRVLLRALDGTFAPGRTPSVYRAMADVLLDAR